MGPKPSPRRYSLKAQQSHSHDFQLREAVQGLQDHPGFLTGTGGPGECHSHQMLSHGLATGLSCNVI